jgi:predicted acetyltransferase
MSTQPLMPRPLEEHELEQLLHTDEIAFGSEPASLETIELERSLLEIDRTIGVFDGPALVGGATLYSFEMTVPGGRVPLAGVSFVSVLPTHRRREILNSMMRYQLEGLHESGGEAVAGLTASEQPIYGRYGYGPATQAVGLTVPRHRNAMRLPAGVDEIKLRMIPNADSLKVCEEVYARQVPKRPGMLVRSPAWGQAYITDPDQWRAGRSKLRTVLAERDGQVVGFTRYRTKADYEAGMPAGRVDVVETHGDDPTSHATLLRYLMDLDLTSTIALHRVPIDSPVVHLLMSPRAAEMRIDDILYVRLVDVDRALASRTYATQIDLVIEVADVFCPWNDGRWRLLGDEKGATCERTSAAPDLAIGARELGAVYLGGTKISALAAAGLVEERRSGAVTEASRAFAADMAPWLSFGF